jgi:hypothetical protein
MADELARLSAIAHRRAIAAAILLIESMRPVIDSSADADVHKGAIEHDDPCDTSNAPGLDDDGLPNDAIAIAEDAIGAREDGSQG